MTPLQRPENLLGNWKMDLMDCCNAHIDSIADSLQSRSHFTGHSQGTLQMHLTYVEINHPAVVIDKEGNILLWYLPNAFNKAEIWNLLGTLRIPLVQSMKSNGAGGWWHDSDCFHQATDLKGTIDLSPAWFQQAHGPSNPLHHPEVSLLLKEKSQPRETRQWLDSMAGLHTILLGALQIMHPKMYLNGQEALM
ncbi:hypothetical protein F5J12DRAFT_785313 [Pisolithus orientalis]|uniref:uncharacterized protein n=1 Tax=Pisolithus orientalis TaxID=936130 RepID=UPI002224FD62|nr:uncharacterized protein F5J12DRAFT_785313 [Pisolithus orientalis]KAI5996901.1 hypothetical protein F5J12DRAFT_785313 [Pisolithus orientalis]